MNARSGLIAAIVVLCGLTGAPQNSSGHKFGIEGDHFVLDGKPFQIISGEMHYARIPREYWRDRLKKARAIWLNTVSTYVFWNVHEPRPGVYDFSGNADVAEFIRMAQQEGLYVILRPGRTPVRSGIWADSPRGCLPIPRPSCAVQTRNSWALPSVG